MERCLQKSAADRLEQGFSPTAMIEPTASAAGRGPQRAEGPQPLCYTPHGAYEQPDGEGQNGNSRLSHSPADLIGEEE
jgi:hypothetical protein